jgi:hypothetical protein
MTALANATQPTSTNVVVLPDSTSVATPSERRRIPLTIPSAQEYYWRYSWQRDERESLEGHDSGESVVFDSDDAEDAARWLRESDDE